MRPIRVDSALDALLHLRSDRIPSAHKSTDSKSEELDTIKQALGSLQALTLLMIRASARQSVGVDDDTPNLVHEAYGDVWRWTSFLYVKCIVKQAYGKIMMQASLHAMPSILFSFGWNTELRRSMISTPGLISMLTRHWLEEDTLVEQGSLEWDDRHFALALENLLRYDSAGAASDSIVIHAITSSTEGKALTVTRVCLEHLRSMMRLKYSHYDAYSLPLILIHKLCELDVGPAHPTRSGPPRTIHMY